MDSFELNKIAGAVLATGLLVMALSITSEIIYEPEDLRENGYVIAVAEGDDHGQAAEAAAAIEPIEVRLQVASVSGGESSAKKCQACHTFEKGGPPKVGPNLFGIVGAKAAHMPGFNYSGALVERQAAGMEWTFAKLDDFLANPKAEVPGTLMAFAGLKKPDERADVIAYLRTLADSPVPLPEPPAEAATEDAAAAAEGEAAAAAGEAATAEGEATQGEAAAAEGEAVEAEADAAAAEREATAAESEAMSAESEATATDTMAAPEAPAADTMATPPAAEMPAPPAEMPPVMPEPVAPATESAQ